VSPAAAEDIAVSLALATDKPLADLTQEDFQNDRFGAVLLEKSGQDATTLATAARESIVGKIQRGLKPVSKTVFLHTEPHHDDIMLGYLAYIYHLVRDPSNQHYFANLTSGFTSVSNSFFLSKLEKLERLLEIGVFYTQLKEKYFDPQSDGGRMEDVYLYLDGKAANSSEMTDEADARRLLRNLVEMYKTHNTNTLHDRTREIIEYVKSQYPGAKDPPHVQLLKGMIREFEVELLWAYFGIETSAIFPLRLGFYTGDIFSQEPEINRDVMPIFALLKKVKPNVVSVAFDPEGSGPDTHYKALQAVSEALKMYEKENAASDIRVWGYRNVWYRYRPAEVNLMPPVSLNTLSMLHTAFMNCFGSQSAASFPSYEHDGPFSELAQKIQVSQYAMIKTCLGQDFFTKNEHPRLRAARGLMFLKEMPLAEFYEHVRELKKLTEDRP